jgi:hypothetical protein
MTVGLQEYLLPMEPVTTSTDNKFTADYIPRPPLAYTDVLHYDGSLIENIDGGLRLPEPVTGIGVGDWYGPYQVTHEMGNSGTQTITTAMSPSVWLVKNSGTATNWIVVNSGVTTVLVFDGTNRKPSYDPPISINSGANVTIYLAAGTSNFLESGGSFYEDKNAGILVDTGSSLTIEGPGDLTVKGGDSGAGIGGYWRSVGSNNAPPPTGPNTGSITLSGTGTIRATGGARAAGIGGGTNGQNGTITVNSGTIYAEGGAASGAGQVGGGAGIGGGGSGSGRSSPTSYVSPARPGCAPGGVIIINGGNITANSYGSAAAIGGGYNSDAGSTVGSTKYSGAITIGGSSTIVTARANNAGPGIGGGAAHKCDTITITDGTIYAYGNNQAAAIGNGLGASGGTITITGGTIVARGANAFASGVGGGDTGAIQSSATVNISGGSVLSVNASTPPKVRINYNPTNGPDHGDLRVYMIGVLLMIDGSSTIVPNAVVNVYVDNVNAQNGVGQPYLYTATTNAQGRAYLWLPVGIYDYLIYNPDTGFYRDGSITVNNPGTDEYDEFLNSGNMYISNTNPIWSVSTIGDNNKSYGTALLDVNVNHSNSGNHQDKQIFRVRWYRESVQNPAITRDDFGYEYNLDQVNNGGRNGGTGLLGGALNLIDPLPLDRNRQHYQMPLDCNGRYWVEITYRGANTGRIVVHTVYVDVTNVYTPVNVYVRGYIPGSGGGVLDVDLHSYTLLTDKLVGNVPTAAVYGIPLDADGELMLNPNFGYDKVRYYRPPSLPTAYWDMQPESYPFDSQTQLKAGFSDMELGRVVLGSDTYTYTDPRVFDGMQPGTPIRLNYRVVYQPQNMAGVTAYFVNAAGASIPVNGQRSASFMVPLDVPAGINDPPTYECNHFNANGGTFIPPVSVDPAWVANQILARGYYVIVSNTNNGHSVTVNKNSFDQNTFYYQENFADFDPKLAYGNDNNANAWTLDGGKRLYIVFAEPPPEKVDFIFYKVEQDGQTPLPGVSFALFECTNSNPLTHNHSWMAATAGSCWGNPTSATSSAAPTTLGRVAFPELGEGQYMLLETATAPGYQLPMGQWLITVSPSGSVMQIGITAHGPGGNSSNPGTTLPSAFKKVTDSNGDPILLLPNFRLVELPGSGGLGVTLSTSTGIVLFGSALLFAFSPRAKIIGWRQRAANMRQKQRDTKRRSAGQKEICDESKQ